MKIMSAFNLFMQQALKYPLTSPFLPEPADVKLGVSYANHNLTGTLSCGPIWQTNLNIYLTWYNAIIYAQYLEIDGITISEVPQNIWRLPKLGEILNALSQQFVEGGTSGPGGFAEYTYYWSSSELDSDFAWYGYYVDYGFIYNYFDYKVSELSVRCVR